MERIFVKRAWVKKAGEAEKLRLPIPCPSNLHSRGQIEVAFCSLP